MIHIAPADFDAGAALYIEPTPADVEDTFTRRVARAATLAGGVAVSDRGYAPGDRTLVYRWRPVSKAQNDIAKRIVATHPTVKVSTPDGVYLAAPESFNTTPTENTFTLLVIEQLSEG